MAKRYRDAPFRSVSIAAGKDDWLRNRRFGQTGYREPQPEISETYRPRSPDHQIRVYRGPLPVSVRTVETPAKSPRPPASVVPIKPDKPSLPVPLPTAGSEDDRTGAPPRPGQFAFRAAVIAAYGRCAVTGCQDEAALEAAHIVPFVDERSHRLENALCLRADIHALYDRGLLAIDAAGVVAVASSIRTAEYKRLHGRQITRPAVKANWPNPALLSKHVEFVRTAVIDALRSAREEAGKAT